MAETGSPSTPSLKGLREQMVAAAQALAEERRNQSGGSPVPVPSLISIKTATKPVIDGSLLRSEERQRLAKERREEREKQHAAKETQLLEKEKKAKLQYEKQMEEKQRKLKEQKLKEQQRRTAVEEKRKQKIEEEKEHYEAVVHRTLERSQRLETRQKRWSWGGSVTDSDGKTASKRSSSSANLKQVKINKRLSSSAALLNSPSKRAMEKKRSSSLNRMGSKLQSSTDFENVQKEEKAARRSQFIPLESNVISRLLAPTQASLARSKSAATLSADGRDPSESPLCPRSALNSSPAHGPKAPVRSRSIDRLKTITASSSDSISLEHAQRAEVGKQSLSPAGRRTPSPSLCASRRSPSPAKLGKRPPSPAAISRQKPRPPSPSILKPRPSSPVMVSKPAPIQRPSLTPNVLNIPKKKPDMDCKPKEKVNETAGQEQGPYPQISERDIAANASKTKEVADANSKSAPGTTSAEEAARVLAEKRRLAREQREREVLERALKEEEERVKKEEIAKRALEEQAQREDELRQLEEQRKIEEEEQQRLAEKERVRREEEEQEKLAELQQQREDAEAKAQEEANRHRQEQERIMQQNMQERLERRKRIEEIMKRTRKAEQNETRNEEKSNEEDEDIEDEFDLGLEKQDQPEKANYIDSPLEDAPESLLQEASKIEPNDVFINGNEQLEINQTDKDENSEHFTQIKEASPPAKEAVIENSAILHVNEANHPTGFLSNLNGKSLAWNFEEIIDLEVIPKTTRQSSDSIAAEMSNLNLKDATPVPPSPKVVFEEDSTMNPLTKPIETASEL
ncbi:MAP7 domain-containing protein 3 isoform X8 [Heteronotia binoei]|uniref:MAP7 domain-containing protein 3 isoform X8 n=1 Tax=Heteronotia binoei TaxID=13085 RepID=UPI00292E8015|nr:MAP7 domain-containing protein 3 isoform X8 [Heteronotia binoei]